MIAADIRAADGPEMLRVEVADPGSSTAVDAAIVARVMAVDGGFLAAGLRSARH